MHLFVQIVTAAASGATAAILAHFTLRKPGPQGPPGPQGYSVGEPLPPAPREESAPVEHAAAPIEPPASVTTGTQDAAGPLVRLPAREGAAATEGQA